MDSPSPQFYIIEQANNFTAGMVLTQLDFKEIYDPHEVALQASELFVESCKYIFQYNFTGTESYNDFQQYFYRQFFSLADGFKYGHIANVSELFTEIVDNSIESIIPQRKNQAQLVYDELHQNDFAYKLFLIVVRSIAAHYSTGPDLLNV